MTYYSRAELTRPGHTPSLTSGPTGARATCTCGWSTSNGLTMTDATIDVRIHIGQTDGALCACPSPVLVPSDHRTDCQHYREERRP